MDISAPARRALSRAQSRPRRRAVHRGRDLRGLEGAVRAARTG